ncbi:hypothetical protein B0H15DRAFT_774060 [Mycena belliarum]|uniref:RRM domain-containing protein n=1 Tax=Mycena belliarum TaxID=1033014 RepID=A0AAD6XQP2_9AGAR|nr:hypothetical protein B0H15DRAFT_774060 [Mycena belliae]
MHDLVDNEADQIFADSPVLSSQQRVSSSPPRAPSRPTIPLPPVDADPPPFSASRPRSDSAAARAHAPKNVEPSAPPGAPAEPEKTPNVYINGLPPNFPEDQLFALAAPFGAVRSVRSFTRHVGDAETGYGFVLFETIASAEKCINSLRRYRNLHPTFSKQVHKIPGTMYSQPRQSEHGISASATTPSASSLAGWEQESAGEGSADSTFKAKMERLADKASTNLYIEGLPLSIDEATLAALVSPYAIRSSRFFQTKLSSPPRIIAFVRLETRSAAEEIIERLHGRMVRGWNDPGSRISVRFADTSEQRELRRTERIAREGDQAPTQLSIAQATLLNLRGKDLGGGANVRALDGGYADEYTDFQSNGALFGNVAPYAENDFEVDYSRVPARYPQQQPLSHFTQQQQNLPTHPAPQRMNPAMASLLDSLQASGAALRGRETYAQDALSFRALQQQQQLAALANPHALRSYAPQGLGIGHAQPHPGYTATEEFILRARANSLPQKRRPAPLELDQEVQARYQELEGAAGIGMGVRGYRAQAATLSFPHHQHQQQQHGLAPIFDSHDSDSLNEEDFHAANSNMTGLRPAHASNNMMNMNTANSNSNSTNNASTLGSSTPHSHSHSHSHPNSNSTGIYERAAPRRHNGASYNGNGAHIYSTEADQSPPLVSPALTYSSRSSASVAAFSPTTPFFGGFDEDETFRAQQMDGKGKKSNARTATR